MKTFDRSDPGSGEIRAHPWTVATTDPRSRYFDLKAAPGLIRTSLEDFLPWAAWPAVDTFYSLLEWLNGAGCVLESNDCAFEGPSANTTTLFPKAFEATGRLMLLWRALGLNLSRDAAEWLKQAIQQSLSQMDPDLENGAVGITVYPVRYITLPLPEEQQHGFQLMVSFWSWGDTTGEVMGNLARTLRNLWEALAAVERTAREAIRGRPHAGQGVPAGSVAAGRRAGRPPPGGSP